MKKAARVIFILFVIIINILYNCCLSSGQLFRSESVKGTYKLNIITSLLYKTEVFDDPFGDDSLPDGGFLVTPDGKLKNEKGQIGEYAYLGYNYDEEEITNDRYFSKLGRRGNVFDQDYSNVEWQEIPEAWNSWMDISQNSALFKYILTTNFYDDDHVTEGKTDTGYNLLRLFEIPEGSDDYTEIYMKAKVLTTPETGSGYIYLRYYRPRGRFLWLKS